MSKELEVLGPFSPFGLSSIPTEASSQAGIDGIKYFLFESFDSEHRLQSILSKEPKESNIYFGSQSLNQCLNAADGVFTTITGEEEISVVNNTVVWSSGGAVKKSFTLEKPIIQAMVVHFKSNILANQNGQKSEQNEPHFAVPSELCVLHSGTFCCLVSDFCHSDSLGIGPYFNL